MTRFPMATKEAAAFLGVGENKLSYLIRTDVVDPAPAKIAGRRLWGPVSIRQAAEHLGSLSPSRRRVLDEAATLAGALR